MPTSGEYEQKAAECLRLARVMSDNTNKALLHQMALAWIERANQIGPTRSLSPQLRLVPGETARAPRLGERRRYPVLGVVFRLFSLVSVPLLNQPTAPALLGWRPPCPPGNRPLKDLSFFRRPVHSRAGFFRLRR